MGGMPRNSWRHLLSWRDRGFWHRDDDGFLSVEVLTFTGCLGCIPYAVSIYLLLHPAILLFLPFWWLRLLLFCLLLLILGRGFGFFADILAAEVLGIRSDRNNVIPKPLKCCLIGVSVCVSTCVFFTICALSWDIHRYWQLSAPWRGLSICGSDWKDSDNGLYFDDGTVGDKVFRVNISECTITGTLNWFFGSERSCTFVLHPILACPKYSDFGCTPQTCALAVSIEGEPARKEFDQIGQGLCGWATAVRGLVAHEEADEFSEALRKASDDFQVPSELPLLRLGDPHQRAKDLAWMQPWYYLMVLAYYPLWVLVLFIKCILQGGGQRFFNQYYVQLSEETETESEVD